MDRIVGARELLDGPLDRRLLAGNLRDLQKVNRWLGGASLSWRALRAVVGEPNGGRISLLDVGTGAADIPLELLRRAAGAPFELAIEATDVRPEIVEFAARRAAGRPNLTIRLADSNGIDAAAGSFDVVHASLVLHHLDEPAAGGLLAEMSRVARRAVIVNDLVRARRWWVAAWMLSRLATRNRYTRHDAPLSVQRAYLPSEVEAMAAHAGLRPRSRLGDPMGHRYALVLEHAR